MVEDLVHPCKLLNDSGIEIPDLIPEIHINAPGCMVITVFLVDVRYSL